MQKSKVVKKKYEDADDPFLQGSTNNEFDSQDPFDLEMEREFLRRNVLSRDVITHPLIFCDARTLLIATQVNRTWHEAADSDKVWKVLCKSKWGSDTVRENKPYLKNLGWKLAYFVGVCKTILVNTPEKNAIALVPYPGLTIRDILNSIGIEKIHHFRVTCSSFSEEIVNEIDEMEGEGCWPTLAACVLSDILVEPFATVYVESIRRKDRRNVSEDNEEDDDNSSANKDAQSKMAEEQAKLAWKTRAISKLSRQPKFIWNSMQSHWASLCPPVSRQGVSSKKPTSSSSNEPIHSQNSHPPQRSLAAKPTTTAPTTTSRAPTSTTSTRTPISSSSSSSSSSRPTTTVSHASGKPKPR